MKKLTLDSSEAIVLIATHRVCHYKLGAIEARKERGTHCNDWEISQSLEHKSDVQRRYLDGTALRKRKALEKQPRLIGTRRGCKSARPVVAVSKGLCWPSATAPRCD